MLLQGNPLSPLTPLILVHAISGLALPNLALSPLSQHDRPVYGITSPTYGGDDRYRLPSSLRHVARQYLALIKREVQPMGPYLLGGWSMGGVIALNMADLLRQQHETVLHVIMIDSGCPGIYPPFHDRAEHEAITALLFAAVTEGRSTPRPAGLPPGSGGSSESGDDASEPDQVVTRMQKHIQNGLTIISHAGDTESLAHGYDSPVTLIKCSAVRQAPSVISSERKAAMRRIFLDEKMCWDQEGNFADFTTIKVSSQHDNALDKEHAGDLSRIIENIIVNLE